MRSSPFTRPPYGEPRRRPFHVQFGAHAGFFVADLGFFGAADFAFFADAAGFAADTHHQASGAGVMPAASSITWPARNTVSSSNDRPMICSPSGRPSFEKPAGTEIPGRPAMLTVTVKMSLRYISIGSPPFSPSPKAGVGVAGVRIASTVSNASSKSRLISVRTF